MNKKNIILVLVLIVLVGVYFLSQNRAPKEKIITFFDADSINIKAIELISKDDTVKIAKINNQWNLIYPVEYIAETSKIKTFFDKVVKIESSSLPVSENESSQGKYNVNDSTGTLVRLLGENDKLISEGYIGKSSNYNNSYGRKPESKKIYQLSSNISYHIKPFAKNWRKKSIMNIEEIDIDRFEVKSSDLNYGISASDSLWKYQDGKEEFYIKENNAPLKQILNRFNVFNASDFLDNDFETYKTNFENPDVEVIIHLKDGSTQNFKIAKAKEDKYYAFVNGNTTNLFQIPESILKQFQKTVEDFQK